MTELLKTETEAPEATQGDPEEVQAPESSNGAEISDETEEDKTVKSLRDEAASYRIKLKEANQVKDGAIEKLRALTLASAGAGVLADPLYSLEWDDVWNGDDGLPDPEKVKAAAEQLAEARPFLARGPRGDIAQGVHNDSATGIASLSELLRMAR